MSCVTRNSAAAGGGRRVAGSARRAAHWRAGVAAIGLMLIAPAGAAAGDLDIGDLRGSLSNVFASQSYSRWDGINFGAQLGLSNMNADFGNSTSSLIGYILRNTTLENEYAPSNWTTLPSNTTDGRQYGVFLGYNMQWDQLVVGFEGAYNRPSSLSSSAMDSIRRIAVTSDAIKHDVTIDAQSSLTLVDYATVRARAGYAMGQFLPYAMLGGAVGRFNYSNAATVTDIQTILGVVQPAFVQSGSNGKNNAIVGGFTVGLGLDVAIMPNVFLRGEWEFVGFAPVNGIRANFNTGRVGIGVKF